MRRVLAIAAGILAFLAISVLVTRWLVTESTERSAVLRLIRAEARGDAAGVLAGLAPSCRADARCRGVAVADARRLRRAGDPKIVAYHSDTAYALGSATGPTRVAWTVIGNGTPVVQCVLVRRTGTAVAGRRVTLLRVSAPIRGTATC